MVMMGDFFGMYGVGSGAGYEKGTDYSNADHRRNMLASVTDMVITFKDEPYVLMWVLGNESEYSLGCNVKENPKAYYQFVNEAAKLIHQLDPTRPVAISNGTTEHLKLISKYAPEVDIFMINAYWGSRGFGNLWKNVKRYLDRPVVIGEYGCPAYHEGQSQEIAETEQAYYLRGCWEDVMANTAGSKYGNALGVVVYQWMDEWWLSGKEPAIHNTDSRASGPFPDGWGHSEWFGICGQGDGKNSPFLREIRKSYYTLQELWAGKQPL
jgi:beta-glucuronidase